MIKRYAQFLIWAGVAAWALASCQSAGQTKGTTELPIAESALENAVETAPTNLSQDVGVVPMKGLMLTVADDLNLRATPGTSAEILETLPRNTVLIYSGERTTETVDMMMKGKTWSGTWVKIKSLDPEAIGWLFEGTYKGQSTLESIADEDLVKASEAQGRILAPIPWWSAHEVGELLELPFLEPVAEGYSGYYQFHRNEMDEETLDGKFWICAQPSNHEKASKIVYWGSFAMGKKTSIGADFTGEGWEGKLRWKFNPEGQFQGRTFQESVNGKTILNYEDQIEALNLHSIVID